MWPRGPVARVGDLAALHDGKAAAFLARAVSDIDWTRYGVGFTVVFQQMVASLALAKAIKRGTPEMPIIFGGRDVRG